MATLNPFDLLGDNDTEDPSLLIAASQQKVEPKKSPALAGKQPPPAQNREATAPQAKLPSKPLPPAQAVREARSEFTRGGRGSGRGYGRGRGAGGGSYRDSQNKENSFGSVDVPARQGAIDASDAGKASERRPGYAGSPRGAPRGARREGFGNGEIGDGDRDRPHRTFDRRSGTGRGSDIKRGGAGRGNWGTQADDVAHGTEEVVAKEEQKPVSEEKPQAENEPPTDGDKEASAKEFEGREAEDKEMTLEEYEKLLEEKRKALLALKTEERKVDTKEFESMQQLSKKGGGDVFIKLGSEKDKKKELAEKEEKAKKSVSINEFLKPAEGERYYNPGGRGRGRGRGPRGGYTGVSGLTNNKDLGIEDPGQFPILSAK